MPDERILELSASRGAVEVSYALVYPNRHALGMANLGFQQVLALLSSFPGASCHRAFSDFPRTIEAGRGLRDYDVVALSLSFEGDYPEALRMLSAAGIPLRSEGRSARDPLVVGGGVAVSLNPEPLAPFLDAVFVGEAEAGLEALHELVRESRGRPRAARLEFLADARLPGVYVPARYEVEEEGGCVISRQPLGRAPETVERRWAPLPWEPARSRVVAAGDAFGGAYLLEVSRGCPHGCRFCAAGYATRPARFLSFETLRSHVDFGVKEVGRLGFVGAAVSDHPEFRVLAQRVLDRGAQFTVSSFRVENLDGEVLGLLARGGLKTPTIAVEAGTEALRRRLGKTIVKEDLLRAARLAAEAGIESLRLYAMVGLPGEEEADVRALAELAREARAALGGGMVTLSVAPFVPKPHTPLQWETMAPEATLRARIRLLESLLGRQRGLRAVAEVPKWSRVQGLLSRGGRSVAALLERAAADDDWRAALRTDEAAAVLDRPWHPEERLPWGFLTGVPSSAHLELEREGARSGASTLQCRSSGCRSCGICSGEAPVRPPG